MIKKNFVSKILKIIHKVTSNFYIFVQCVLFVCLSGLIYIFLRQFPGTKVKG